MNKVFTSPDEKKVLFTCKIGNKQQFLDLAPFLYECGEPTIKTTIRFYQGCTVYIKLHFTTYSCYKENIERLNDLWCKITKQGE